MTASVSASQVAGYVLMWCNLCGPMGVSPDAADAIMVARRHLEIHGEMTDEQ